MKIHQTKAGCRGKLSNLQRKFHKSEVGSIQEENHSSAAGCVSSVEPLTHPQTRRTAKLGKHGRKERKIRKAEGGLASDPNQSNLKHWRKEGGEERSKVEEMGKAENEKEEIMERREKETQSVMEIFEVELTQKEEEIVIEITEMSDERIRNHASDEELDKKDENGGRGEKQIVAPTEERKRDEREVENEGIVTKLEEQGNKEKEEDDAEGTKVLGGTREVWKEEEQKKCIQTKEAHDVRKVVEIKRGDRRKVKMKKATVKGSKGTRDIREWLKLGEKEKDDMEEKEKGEKEDLPNLKELEKKVERGCPNEILVKNNMGMTRTDLRALVGNNYLNDKIIDEYFLLIKQRNEREQTTADIEVCTVFLYHMLDKFGLEEGSNRTKNWIKSDLTKKDLILVPIHKLDHWSLVYIDNHFKTVYYLDSIIGSRKTSGAPGMMKKYIEEYYRRKGEEVTFKVKIRTDIPVQKNGVDCGVFVCQYAERVARRAPFSFKQADMPAFRSKMLEEIAQGKLSAFQPYKSATEAKPRREKEEETQVNHSRNKPEERKSQIGKVDGKERNEGGNKGRKEAINWPKSNSPEWKRLDEDISTLLRTIYSSPEKKAETHPVIIYQMCKERFGVKEQKKQNKSINRGPSRRQRKCKQLREDINKLKEAYQQAPAEEKEAINQLQQEKLKKLRLTKRAETMKCNRQKLTKNCKAFFTNPFEFAREVIAPKPNGEMQSTKEEVEEHLRTAHSVAETCEDEATIPEDLYKYEEPAVDFKNTVPDWREFTNRLRKTRSKSAPGPNGVPYVVYKRCQEVAKLLWHYIKGIWRKNTVSDEWRKAEGIFIPKEEGAKTVDKFRTISLLNVEGKLYFALRADRLLSYAVKNGYIDTSIQKGGVPGVSGCLEHTAILSQMIREAKAEKKNLTVTWLDIANAYGSMPHSVIQVALQQAHVPEEVRNLIDSYYSDVKIRFSTNNFTTEWQRVEKGIITGCTLSVVLFTLAMTMLVMSVKDVTRGPKMTSGKVQKSCRLFMDDLNTTTETQVQTKGLLEELATKLNWAKLTPKPEKCRSLVILRGKISKRTLELNGKPITSITEKPVKYLGKSYNMKMDEKEQIEQTVNQAKSELKMIEKCRLPGRYKGWIVQHMLLPRIMWPLSIYNVPVSKVEEIQGKITTSLKRWLGLPKSLSTDCFYSKSTKVQLPYTALTEEVKVAKARNLVTLEESRDPCIQKAGIKVDGGRKANTPGEVEDAKSRLRLKEIAGIANVGREGLGLKHRQYYSSCSKKEKRAMIVEEIREIEEEKRRTRIINLVKQGANTRWEVPEKKLTHRDIIQSNEVSLKFLMKSVYDLLPTPANKNKWFDTDEKCQLCGGCGTLNHILSGCPVALAQGRYTWRHNQVLKEIAQCVEVQRQKYNSRIKVEKKKHIAFVKAGEGGKQQETKSTEAQSFLEAAQDWSMQVDLKKQLKVPHWISETNLRPDILLISERSKQMGVIELTVPSEERIEVSGELKRTKYEAIAEAGRQKGWKVRVWTAEVGCRGFPAASVAILLRDLGYQGSEKRVLLRKIGEAAERASNSVWRWSHFKVWEG